MTTEIGRNSPCPCGSGEKYKKCCGLLVTRSRDDNSKIPDERHAHEMLQKIEAREKQRVEQQGHGHPIISAEMNNYRFVAVGKVLYRSTKPGQWKTFHDFLKWYIVKTLESKWFENELKKQLKERHPILQWHYCFRELQEKAKLGPKGIYSEQMTGAIAAYLGLAYNLYLIAHNNVDIQTRLIQRLKNLDHFHGAYYETYVAASFIKAGFELEYENEDDSSITHCEFTAICKVSGQRHSVEAKTRAVEGVLGKRTGRKSEDPNVRNQLYSALKKEAKYPRIIFIDVNVPEGPSNDTDAYYLLESLKTVRAAEKTMTIDKNPAPPAYVFLTNHTYHYNKDSTTFHAAVLADSFKIKDFQHDKKGTLREALDIREKHKDIHRLIKSLKDHYSIPSTFDGEYPEFAFGDNQVPRLIIGNTYLIPDGQNGEVSGILEEAIVMEPKKEAVGIYKTLDGKRLIINVPMTDTEMAAYKKHPNSFFGVYKPKQKANNPLELFDFFFKSYENTPKKRLLEFMKTAPDIEELRKLTQKKLASTYCERTVNNILTQKDE